MTDNLKQVLEVVKELSYEEIEALSSVLFSINYDRKEQAKKDMNQYLQR